MQFSKIWDANKYRKWPSALLKIWNHNISGKDLNTIKFWIDQIDAGINIKLILTRKLEVQDGNHRLIAGHICRIQDVKFEVI